MAYVKVTDALVGAVQGEVNNMLQKALDACQLSEVDKSAPVFNSLVQSLEKTAWKAAPHTKGQLPHDWLHRVDRVELRALDEHGDLGANVRLELSGYGAVYVPGKEFGRYVPHVDVEYADQDQVLRDWVAEEKGRAAKRQELAEQYAAVKETLTYVLRGHNSLNTAIKDVPELELYVPDEYLERLRRKVQRSAPAKTEKVTDTLGNEIEIDRDTLTVLGVAHRMNTAAE